MVSRMKQEMLEELTSGILPFWMNKMCDEKNGGFYGRIDGRDKVHPTANKGSVLNARILWTFSAAYRILKNPDYRKIAERAFDYMVDYFIDKKYGGVYWESDCKGNPVNTKKQTYAQGFALYGFSEYHRATGDLRALELCKEFYFLSEKCRDKSTGGYFEAFTREWSSIEDMRLSDKDANEKKTMNTHLHILEPYTNLCRIWDDDRPRESQKLLIDIFTDRILNSDTYHLNLFFDEMWNPKSSAVSYGHDIEAAWLLYEAAEASGDPDLINRIKAISLKIADAASEGLMSDGSMIYESDGEHRDEDRHWWVQAEAVTGCMYAYKLSGDVSYKEKAERIWNYIKKNIVADKNCGEWHWSIKTDGSVDFSGDKAGFWKCPYHNGRMCMELIEHF